MDKSGNFMDLAHGVDAESARALAGEHQNGYHVLFLVQKITDRLDAGEQAILRIVRRFYGESVLRRIVLLLTYSDVADTDEEISNMVTEGRRMSKRQSGEISHVPSRLTTTRPGSM